MIRTDRFVSLLAEGYQYTGGAHGLPIYGTFTYDLEQDRLLALTDFFADTTALVPLSRYVQDALARQMRAQWNGGTDLDESARTWIEEGSAPTASNYQFYVMAADQQGQPSGFRILFPPYQVGPYAAGTFEVVVPAAHVQEHLAPSFQSAFSAAAPADPGARL